MSQAECTKVEAHVKEVGKVRFNCDGTYMMSIGKRDRAIMLWQVLPVQGVSTSTVLVPLGATI